MGYKWANYYFFKNLRLSLDIFPKVYSDNLCLLTMNSELAISLYIFGVIPNLPVVPHLNKLIKYSNN